MSEEIATAAADLATVARLRSERAELSRHIGELCTTIGYQDAMLDALRAALRPFATYAALALHQAAARGAPLRNSDIAFRLDDTTIAVGDMRRAVAAITAASAAQESHDG